MDLRLDGQARAPAAARRGRPPLAAGRHRGRRARARASGSRSSATSRTASPSSSRRASSSRWPAARGRSRSPGALLPGTVPVAVSGDLPARVEKDALRVQVRGGRYSVSVEARVDGRPKAIGLPKEPPEGALAAARGVGLRRRRDAAAGRALRPHAHRPLADRAARGVARAAGVPRGARARASRSRRCGGARPSRRPTRSPSRASSGSIPTDAARASATASAARCARPHASTSSRPARSAASPSTARTSSSPPTPRRRRPESSCGARPCSSRPTRASRLGGAIPAVGWTTGVEQLQATLHVPPGWSLLGATGVDRLPGTWTSRWTLLGFFFVLIVTLAVHRLFGLRPAAPRPRGPRPHPRRARRALRRVAEPRRRDRAPAGGSRRLDPARSPALWFLASAAVLVVLRRALRARPGERRALPAGRRGRRRARRAPGHRPRQGRCPGRRGRRRRGRRPRRPAAARRRPAEDKLEEAASARRALEGGGAGRRRAAGLEARPLLLQRRPRAGPEGRPADRPRRPGLDLAELLPHVERTRGPRPHDAALPPLARDEPPAHAPASRAPRGASPTSCSPAAGRRSPAGPEPRARSSRLLLRRPSTLAGLLAPAAARAQSETPSPEILQELKAAPHPPRPLRAEVRHDAEPRPADRRQPPPAERRGPRRGRRHVAAARPRRQLDPGRDPRSTAPPPWRSRASPRASSTCASRAASTASRPTGPVPPGDSFTLQFADPPRRARAEAPGWDVSGLRADGPAEPSILLTRRLAARAGAASRRGSLRAVARGHPHARLRRHVDRRDARPPRDPRGRADRAARAAPPRRGAHPRQPRRRERRGGGEPRRRRDRGRAGSRRSSRPRRSSCAPPRAARGPRSGSCSAARSGPAPPTGLPPVSRLAEGVFAPEYRPWPGESITVGLAHPQGVEGQTLTIDDVTPRGHPRPPPRARPPRRHRPQQPRAAPRPAHPAGGRGAAGRRSTARTARRGPSRASSA